MNKKADDLIVIKSGNDLLSVLEYLRSKYPNLEYQLVSKSGMKALEDYQNSEIKINSNSQSGNLRAKYDSLSRTHRATKKSNHAIIRAKEEQKLLSDICDIIIKDCGYELVWIGYAENDEKRSVRPVAFAGFDEEHIKALNISWAENKQGKGPAGKAIRSRRPVVASNFMTEPDFEPWREEALKRGYSSGLSLPLVHADYVIGVINIYSKETGQFTDEEIDLLSEIAADLAFGITTIRRNKQLESLLEERDKLTDSLKKSKDLLYTTLSSIGDGVIATDTEGRVSFMNPVAEDLTGWKIRTALGKRAVKVLQIRKEYGQAMTGGNIGPDMDSRVNHGDNIMLLRKDGREIPIEDSEAPIKDKSGDVQGSVIVFRDITNRKKAESELKEANQRFENVIDLLPDPFFILDSEWRYVFVNNAASVALKMPKDQLVGRIVWDVLPSMVGTERYYALQRIAKGRKTESFRDYSHLIKKWYEYMVYPWKDGIVLLMHDITESKRAEDDLRQSEMFIRDILESYKDAFFAINSKWEMTYINDRALEMVGMKKEEVIGRQLFELFPKSVETDAFNMLVNVMENKKPISYEIVSPTLNHWIRVNAYPTNDNGMTVYFQDISELKKAEEELKDSRERLKVSERRFRRILDNSPVAVFTQDVDLRYTWMYQSKMYKSKLNLTNEDFTGRTDYEIEYFKESAGQLSNMKKEVIKSGIPGRTRIEFIANGGEFFVDIAVEPIYNNFGEIEALAGVAVDVTDHVLLEKERSRQQVANLIDRSARLASIGAVAGGITHEINQPLNAIRMGVGSILRWQKSNDNLPEFVMDMIDGISQAETRIEDIIKTIRAFWVNTGQEEMNTVNINEIIMKVTEFNRQKLIRHRVGMKHNLSMEELTFTGNPLRFELVLNNLISNAVHALGKTDRKEKTITISSFVSEGKPVITVEDNGTGLPEVEEERLFDPFFTTKASEEGSGLGLAIVKMFLNKYNATISAYNNESGGATFRIMFGEEQEK